MEGPAGGLRGSPPLPPLVFPAPPHEYPIHLPPPGWAVTAARAGPHAELVPSPRLA